MNNMKLTHRIFLLILIIISLSTLANLLLTQYQKESLHNDSEKILASTIIQSLRDALVQDVIDGNKLRVTNLLRSLKENDNPIEFLYVSEGDDHVVFAHSFQQGFPRFLLQNKNIHSMRSGTQLTSKYQTQQGLIFEYSEALIPGFDAILHIGINQTEIAEKFTENRQSILVMSVVIMSLALSFSYLWSKQITAPLARLTNKIQRFGEGELVDFSKLEKGTPEIQLLASAFQSAVEERQQVLLELQAREQDLAITLDSIGDAVIATDALGNITRMNPVAQKLTGWVIQEALGQSLKDIFPIVDASTRKEIDNPIDKVLSRGEIVHLSNHTTLISKDGTEYQIADSAAPIRDGENNILGMVLVFNDVTEQYQLREARKESEERFRQLAENINEVFWLGTPDWNEVLYVSPAYEKIWEQSAEDLYLNPNKWLEAIHPDDREQVIADIPKGKDYIDGVVDFRKYRIQRSDGKILWIKAKAYPIHDEKGNLVRMAGIAENITEQINMENTLSRTQKMDALGKLTGGIAHDYNNMLGIILGYAELLKERLTDHPDLEKYIHEIYHAGERGVKLTGKLLSFSRQKNADSLGINEFLLDKQYMLEKTLTARIKLVFDLGDDLWPTWLGSSELEDVIINLSINAMHAIDGNGNLTIKTRNIFINKIDSRQFQVPQGEYILVSVTDTGCGMDEATKEKIFEPFFSTKSDKGTGLGLSQVYGFVKRSGGEIKVYSEPGQGTKMMLYFPRYKASISNETIDNKSTDKNYRGNENILIVDDEAALLDLTREILEQHGYHISCADSAKQALEILQCKAVDLILSDIIMPEKDGYQLTAIVKEKYPGIKIQLASGFTDSRHADMVDDELEKNILQKPFKAELLLRKIRELLDERL